MSHPQGPGGQPPYGGYPQQGGYPPHGPGQHGYGPPQRKSKTGLVVAIVAVVVVLAAVGITGFVAPGFFLSDDEGAEGGDVSTARGAADAMVSALTSKNAQAVRSLSCPGADDSLEQVAGGLDRITGAKVLQVGEGSAETSVSLEVGLTGGSVSTNGELRNAGSKWCWASFDGAGGSQPSTPGESAPAGPSSEPAEGSATGAKATIEEFLSNLGAGDEAAVEMLCPSEYNGEELVRAALEQDVQASIEGEPTGSTSYVVAKVSGTIGGEPIGNGSVSAQSMDGGATWCVINYAVY